MTSSTPTVIFIEDQEEEENNSNNSNNIPTTADELIAEAFLRCARMRTIFIVWKAKSRDAIHRSKISHQVADMFRNKYLVWSSLQKWRNKAEEQSRFSSMSIIAWGWHAKRSQRKVLTAWRNYIEDKKIQNARNLDILEGMRYEAENSTRLQYFFTWMGFASRGSVANTFLQLRTNVATKRRVISLWKAKLRKRQRLEFLAYYLQSRIQLENVLRYYDAWFLHSFCARYKKNILDYTARLDSIAQVFYHRRVLMTNCLIGKWIPATQRRIADRFHRQHQLSACLEKLKTRFFLQRNFRIRHRNFQDKLHHKQLEYLFQTWKHRSTILSVFAKINQERNHNTKTSVLLKWKQRLLDRQQEHKWKQIGSDVRRDFVLRRGFEMLLDTASKLSWSNQQHQTGIPISKTTSALAAANGASTAIAASEASIRSLLSSFRDLMLTNGADIQIINDNEIPNTSSVKKSALERMKERERLRASIMQLRQNLS